MAVIPQFDPQNNTGLITRIGEAQSLMFRAQEMGIRREQHEMNKRKFGVELLTMDLEQQAAQLQVQNARLALKKQESAFSYEQKALEFKEQQLEATKAAAENELGTAPEARQKFDEVMAAVKDPKRSLLDRQAIVDSWIQGHQGLINSKLNPDLQQEFAGYAETLAGARGHMSAQLNQNIISSAMLLKGTIDSAKTLDELENISRDPRYQYAAMHPEFAKRVAEKQDNLLKHQQALELEAAKAGSNKPKIPSESLRQIDSVFGVNEILDQIELKFKNAGPVGPFLGMIRSKNPYDKTAQALTTYVQSTIPGLARGVFREVGVLTDTDIARYERALPSLRTPEDLAKMIVADLKDRLKRTSRNTIRVYNAAGYDTDGLQALFDETFTELEEDRSGMTDTVSNEELMGAAEAGDPGFTRIEFNR